MTEVTNLGNRWCRTLGIRVPVLEEVVGHPEANTYALLLVALLESGRPLTLPEIARRFEAAGVDDYSTALRALTRCRPDRAPVYRERERYHLDPLDDGLDVWVFRLGLRPPRAFSPSGQRLAPFWSRPAPANDVGEFG